MDLIKVYTEYNNINNELIKYSEEIINSDLNDFNEDIKNKLLFFNERFGLVKIKSDDLSEKPENEENIRDLRYLIVDGLFFTLDLINFYNVGEWARFKMRVTNYIEKKKRADLLKSVQ